CCPPPIPAPGPELGDDDADAACECAVESFSEEKPELRVARVGVYGRPVGARDAEEDEEIGYCEDRAADESCGRWCRELWVPHGGCRYYCRGVCGDGVGVAVDVTVIFVSDEAQGC